MHSSLTVEEARRITSLGNEMSSVKSAWFRPRTTTEGYVAFYLHFSGLSEMFPSMEHFQRKYPELTDHDHDDGDAA